ncbi:DUF2807 domain-containing protein [Sphingomonas sp. BN140010]|uniref:DUF2807 domain-containing protein n=1 Tax=Sphingomonas arvum TaxID=2992113 RepID=A0ABT3JFP0_9SPHN|nr:DUF2807 domain-containing protein [Sphingomonas sp. BN140010]MCW3797897.1 DUF2807 domain-containing protein [Sphingomonas sp. BN140010]
MMNRALVSAILLALAAATPAGAATRSYTVTSFSRVRVEGPYAVAIQTNRGPFARATGDAAALDRVKLRVEGTTLVVSADPGGWGGYPGAPAGPVRIEAGTAVVASAVVNGAGSLDIDRVRGLEFGLNIQGSGVAGIADVQVDRLRIGLAGSASVRVEGKALALTAVVRGPGSLDATGLPVRDAVIGAEGPAVVKASVSGTAKVDAAGLAAVQLNGNPSCQLKVVGTATVDGCR